MTDPRPAPQFGEYATREQQLAHIKSPSPEQIEPSAPVAPASPMVDAQALAASRNQFNTVGTIAFLVYGLIEVVLNAPSFLQLSLSINDQLAQFAESMNVHIDALPASNATAVAGYALIATWVLLWIGAALWSWRRLKAGKLALWVPFAAGVLANLLVGVVMTVLIFRDPTIAAQLIATFGGVQ